MLALIRSRFKSFQKKKIVPYLLYGLGEVFLVVVGILIAVQIDNHNEDSKTSKLKTQYLKSLKIEYERNLNLLEVLSKKNARHVAESRELLKHTGPSANISDSIFSVLYSRSFFDELEYRPSNGVLTELISSGRLGLFSDSLKYELASWDGYITLIRFQEQEHARYRLQIFNLLETKGSFRNVLAEKFIPGKLVRSKFQINNTDLMQLPVWEDKLAGFYVTAVAMERNYIRFLRQKIQHTIRLIERDLITEKEKY